MAYGIRRFNAEFTRSTVNLLLSRINPVPRIGTYLFKTHSNIVLPPLHSLPKVLFPVGLNVKLLKAQLPSSILATGTAHLNLIDLTSLTI